ncbi:MAG: efflux RND transporter permease subunit, partial [Bacteroidales bacterium]|nr:efflux RND transporter permease subunit [Bacteroidales bacterium]
MNSEPNNNSRGIVDSMVKHKGFVYLAVFAIVAVGIVGLFRMNKDEFPTFDIKQGLVAGVYPGANAQEVEEQLTKPLEEVLFSFKEVDRKKTYSYSKDGICYIFADLNCADKKKDEVWSKIKLKLNDATATLPTGVLAVRVLDDFSATSTILVAMTSKEKGYSELQDYAEELSSHLRKIPELASVKILGTRSEEIAVDIDMARVSAYGISPASILLDYQSSALAIPSGSLDNGTIKVPVHVKNAISAENEVAQKIIYSDPTGEAIRLKDIATIERKCSDPTSFVSYNDASALILSIEMRPDNNILSFGEDVDAVLSKYRSDIPDSVIITKITDQPNVVRTSILNFLRDLLISMLVVIMVMLLLFPMRSAIISSSGIPVIIAMTIAVMYLTGINLHTVTLAALITVLGMIVDDSVITMDGYMDKLGRGLKPVAAANASVKELFMPMFMATLAISLMFFP